MPNIAINGLGRVGRAALKILEEAVGACQMIREAFAALGLPAPGLSQVRP